MPVDDFAIGQTNPETFPVREFKAAAARAIEREHDMFNRYPGALGHAGLRRIMAQREAEREGVEVSPDLLALTNGSMQAVTLVGQALMEDKGDVVVTEEFTDTGTISAYKGIGLDMVGIRMDEQGMRMDHLADTLRRLEREGRLPRFIYTLTTYQNPTGTMMPLDRKRELMEIGARYGIPICEDNCYGDVHFEGDKVPALFSLDDGPDQIYIGSLSKILAPGVRLGYLYAREPRFSAIVRHRHDAGSNYFAAAVAAEFYKDGIGAHCDVANPVLKHKRDLLLAALERELSEQCLWSHPVGGLFLWVRLPDDIDMTKLIETANARGFYFAPGQAFHVDGEAVPYIRLAFGHVPDEMIEEGIPVLARSIREARTSNAPRPPSIPSFRATHSMPFRR
ncbi:MAG: PLP-dependent aminotransferase family protein [Gammaproteobacteria bacterium]|nr:PLP-dependent aminotransferase family protein [Gammaproteobacteria bacterium]